MKQFPHFCLLLLVAGLLAAALSHASADSDPLTHPRTHTPDGLRFTLHTGPVRYNPADSQVTAESLNRHGGPPGAPALPYYSAWIALPPDAEAVIRVQAAAPEIRQIGRLPATPDLAPDALPDDPFGAHAGSVRSLEALGLSSQPDPAIYDHDALWPSDLYTLSEPQQWRDLRLVLLTLTPVRTNPVQGTLAVTPRLDVQITFVGGQPERGRSGEISADIILNAAQARHWHALPASPPANAAPTALPVGETVWKITVTADGIHQLDYATLAAAGVPVDSLNPHTLQLLYGGNPVPYAADLPATWSYDTLPRPVAFAWVGNGNNQFEPGEALRFYGWAWDGNRHDRQYIGEENSFWLIADGSSTPMVPLDNPAGYPPVSTWLSTLTFEEDHLFTTTNTDRWHIFPNEADAWYWTRLDLPLGGQPVTQTFPISLPHVHPVGNATLTTEVLSLWNRPHSLTMQVNTAPSLTRVWNGIRSFNLVQQISADTLQPGLNSVAIGGSHSTGDRFFINRITLRYPRLLRAVDNGLTFDSADSGEREFRVDGFTEPQAGRYLVWEISDRLQPRPVPITATDLLAGGEGVTLRIGRSGPTRFIATTLDQLHTPAAIHPYTPPDLTPPAGADWLMIVDEPFRAGADLLAAHRAAHSGLLTHVVNYRDVIAQYGYGLESPEAIRNYLRAALWHWPVAPRYVVLGGDATRNPRQRPCDLCPGWDSTSQNHVLTPLRFVDRFVGHVPVDHYFTMLVGDDLLPDVALGRLSAETPDHLLHQVQKTIRYDLEQAQDAPWTRNVVFSADAADPGSSYCDQNGDILANHIPGRFVGEQFCLDHYLPLHPNSAAAKVAMRSDLFAFMAQPGAGIANYRGHGSVTGWAGGFVSSSTIQAVENSGHPAIVLSADCLDGYFALGSEVALSESAQRLDNERGSVAWWSSVGLGFAPEHTALLEALLDSAYAGEPTSLGQAVNGAKVHYLLHTLWHPSEVWLFTLQGDPALGLPRAEPLPVNLYLTPSAAEQTVLPGSAALFTLTVANTGAQPLTLALSADGVWPVVPSATSLTLGVGESAEITLTVHTPAAAIGVAADTALTVQAAGHPLSRSATLTTRTDPLWRIGLPLITHNL
jgi:hypothetical protein